VSDTRRRHMVLTMFLHPAGYHNYSWRGPDSRAEDWGRLDLIADLAKRAEAAKIDAVFFADTTSAGPVLGGDTKVLGVYEPITSMSALAGLTKDIGLIGTASTTFNLPYNVARQFQGLDTLSGGRAGWNIVTSWIGNENFGIDEMPDGPERYRRANEFVDVCRKLWRSWDADAVIADRESGRWIEPSRLHAIDHDGEYFKVRGPINMPRSPQTGPVLVQAGSSGPGIELGATYAELIYTAQPILAKSIDFYANYKEIVKSKGRRADEVCIIPGILPIIGRTEAEAEEYAAELESWIDYPHAKAQLQSSLGIDISDLDYDDSVPVERFEGAAFNTPTSRGAIFRAQAEAGKTLREMIRASAKASGHQWIVGSASRVADLMLDWFERRACDGFNLNAPSLPEGYHRILDLLVPELQERGLFHDEYAGGTLRENLAAGR